MVKKRGAEKPCAPIRPPRTLQNAAPVAEKPAGCCLFSIRVVFWNVQPEGSQKDTVAPVIAGVPVTAADAAAVHAYRCRMAFDVQADGFDKVPRISC